VALAQNNKIRRSQSDGAMTNSTAADKSVRPT
jgi:hypothetical protein